MGNDRETATKVQDLLTLCLADAIDGALRVVRGNQWFQVFRQEESEKPPAHMIVRNFHESVADCDFQALLKILYFRDEYSRDILENYGHKEAVNKGNRESPFHRTVGRLINDYRNSIAAHASAGKIQRNLAGEPVGDFYDYESALKDMTSVARVFSAVRNENGESYYDLIREEITGKPAQKDHKALIVAVIICAAVTAAAAALFLLKPWENIGVGNTQIHSLEEAQDKVEEFYQVLHQTAVDGKEDAFRKYFTADYSDAEIDSFYQKLRSAGGGGEQFEIMTYTDHGIAAFQVSGTEAGLWTISQFRDGWKMGCVESLEDKIREELEMAYSDTIPADQMDKACFIESYENYMWRPLKQEMYMELGALIPDDTGGYGAVVIFLNGTPGDISNLQMESLNLIDSDTQVELATIKVDNNELAKTLFPSGQCMAGGFNIGAESLKEGINLDHELNIFPVGMVY